LRIIHFGEPLRAKLCLFSTHRHELASNGVHFDLTAVGVDDRKSCIETLGAAKVDSLLELRKFRADMESERALTLGV
jgi:hypothetical protein